MNKKESNEAISRMFKFVGQYIKTSKGFVWHKSYVCPGNTGNHKKLNIVIDNDVS